MSLPRRSRNAAAALMLVLAGTLPLTNAAAQDSAHDYVEVAYSLYNPDWERRENASGVSLLGSKSLGNRFHAMASINLLETDDTGLDVTSARGLPFKNWHVVGAGLHGVLGSRFGYSITASYQGVDVEDNYENGAGISAGLSAVVFGNVELGVEVGWLDLVISDATLVGHAAYRLNGSTMLTARVMDYADWDYTRYEIGLRATF